MGIKRTSSEGAVKKAAKMPPKRKVVTLPRPVEAAVQSIVRQESPATAITGTPVFTPQPDLSSELIAMRAYFISEKRRMEGQEGDALGDWLEAERQLRSEARL